LANYVGRELLESFECITACFFMVDYHAKFGSLKPNGLNAYLRHLCRMSEMNKRIFDFIDSICMCVCSQYRSALLILGTSLRSLGLYSLTSVLNGRVLLADNRHLCFVNTIDWPRITNYRSNAYFSRDDYSNCGKFPAVFCTVCVDIVVTVS